MDYHQGLFSGAVSFKGQYATVKPASIAALRGIHFGKQWPSNCRKMMLEMLSKEDLRFTLGGKEVQAADVTPVFRDLIEKFFKPFLRDAYDEAMILGLVVVKIIKGPGNNQVPHVIPSSVFGKFYELRIYPNVVTGAPIYKVFKLVSQKTGQRLSEPKEDRSLFIFDNMLKPPGINGEIYSPVATLASVQSNFDIMMHCAALADFNLSDPMVVLETDATATGLSAAESGTAMYAPDDPIADLQGVFSQDSANRVHVFKHINVQVENPQTWFPDNDGGRNSLKKQLSNNTVALPTGYHVAGNVTRPERRNDLERMINEYQNAVAVTYGVPRGFMVQDVSFKTAGASELINESLRHTLTRWSQLCSKWLTSVLLHIHFPDQCNYIFGVLQSNNPDGLSPEELLSKAEVLSDMKAVVPVPPAIGTEELASMYAARLISWDEYYVLARSMKGIPTTTIPPEPPRPEEVELKNQLKLQAASAKASAGASAPASASAKKKNTPKRKADDTGDKNKSEKKKART